MGGRADLLLEMKQILRFLQERGEGERGRGGEGASAENGGDLPNEPVHSRQLAWRVELKFGRYFPYLTKYQPRRSSARSDTHIIFKEGSDLLHTSMHLLWDLVQKKVLYCVKASSL